MFPKSPSTAREFAKLPVEMQVLYGDTDSMFVRLPGRSKDAQCHAKAFDG